MFRRIAFVSTIAVVLITFLYAVFNLTLSPYFAKKKSFFINEKKLTQLTDSKYNINWIFKEHTSKEYIVGWVDNNILVLKDLDEVYLYDKRHGTTQKIASCGENEIINTLQLNEQNVLLHYIYDEEIDIKFCKSKLKNEDYEYFFFDENHSNQNRLEIYDFQNDSSEKIFEHRSKWKLIKSMETYAFRDFQAVGCSNNGRFIVWCIENEIGKFDFCVYDTKTKIKKEYIFEAMNRFDRIDDIKLSNDGRNIFFVGTSASNLMTEKSLYQLDLGSDKLTCQLLISDVHTFKFSYDEKYIIYDYLENKFDHKSYRLAYLDLLTKRTIDISDEIIKGSFAVATSKNTVAFVKNNDTSAQLFVKDLGSETSNEILIYSIDQISSANEVFIKWINANKSLIITYVNPSPGNQPSKLSTFIVDISH